MAQAKWAWCLKGHSFLPLLKIECHCPSTVHPTSHFMPLFMRSCATVHRMRTRYSTAECAKTAKRARVRVRAVRQAAARMPRGAR